MKTSIIFLIVIIVIKAVFSAADTALLYVNKAKISQMSKKNKRAKRIKELINNSHKFYGAIEVVITMCELFGTFLAEAAFYNALTISLMTLAISYEASKILSIIIIAVVLSYVLLLFGAILPKKIARNYPERTAFFLVNIVWIVTKLNTPFEKIITLSANVFSRLFGIKNNPKDKLTEKEIRMILREGMDQGIIANSEKEIIFNTLKFDDFLVKDVMIPKDKSHFINITDSKEKILDNIKKYKYTRIPVFKTSKDNVVGVLNIKDIILEYAENNDGNWELKEIIRDVMFVLENQKIADLFKNMQVNSQSFAIVVNDKKEVKGIITLEDIIEKLVGNISDEYDVKK